ncbi:MAG: carboxypeptidase-like regulatory domain-containing protein [Bryobacteraceae bacterium]
MHRRTCRTLVARILFCIGIFLVLNGSRVAWGQATTSLRGTVTDPSGAGVPKATVVLTNVEVNSPRTTTTGPQGDYSFLSLTPGNYQLVVETAGFERYLQTNLQLLVNSPATVNVQLKLGSVNETVAVTSEAPVLNLADASIGNAFNNMQVKQIPLEGRNVPDLLTLQAGVVYTGNRPIWIGITTRAAAP